MKAAESKPLARRKVVCLCMYLMRRGNAVKKMTALMYFMLMYASGAVCSFLCFSATFVN